jgi:hypothetical protein
MIVEHIILATIKMFFKYLNLENYSTGPNCWHTIKTIADSAALAFVLPRVAATSTSDETTSSYKIELTKLAHNFYGYNSNLGILKKAFNLFLNNIIFWIRVFVLVKLLLNKHSD